MQLIIFVCVFFAACNKQIKVDENQTLNSSNKQINADNSVIPKVELGVAELLSKAANKSENSFSELGFLCDLGSDFNGTGDLKKIKTNWLNFEDDNRYRLVEKEDFAYKTNSVNSCACPGICVVMVIDKIKQSGDKFGVLVFSNKLKKGYSWVVKDRDLSKAYLNWSSSTPVISEVDSENNHIVHNRCWIRWNPKENKYDCAET